MASVLIALTYCIYSNVKARKEEKQKRREEQQLRSALFADNPPDSPSEKSTMGQRQQTKEAGGGQHESLREKAMKKVHGKDANPSQLGDPVSIKAETSSNVPTDNESGSTTLRGSEDSRGSGDGAGGRGAGEDGTGSRSRRLTRREQAIGGNPSMLGDPISVKAEKEDRAINAEEEEASTSTTKSKL